MQGILFQKSFHWLKQFVVDPEYKFTQILLRFIKPMFIPDHMWVKYEFRYTFGYSLNLRTPKTFNEKLNWMKLYDRNPLYTILVDKYAVKQYVAKIIGDRYIIKTFKVYNNADDIHLDELPSEFVLKCTHDSGSVVICRDKNNFDLATAKIKLQGCLNFDFYKKHREWPYKNVPRRIIAEEYLNTQGKDLQDYKFFCFDGQVVYYKIDFDRFSMHGANYYDRAGNLMPFYESICPNNPNRVFLKQNVISKMIELAECLSNGFSFVRIDLYYYENKIFFGEFTFIPMAGLGPIVPMEWDRILGNKLNLRKIK